jgi:transcriptional regulator with XRE-family HTH domain
MLCALSIAQMILMESNEARGSTLVSLARGIGEYLTIPHMNPAEQKRIFSETLILQMKESAPRLSVRETRLSTEFKPDSPSHLADIFNTAYPDFAIEEETARKWLKKKGLPNDENLVRLAELLNVTPEYLLRGREREKYRAGVLEFVSEGQPSYRINVSPQYYDLDPCSNTTSTF